MKTHLPIDWYLAQIKPNCAKIAKDNLHRQGFETFLPLQMETRKRRGKFVNVSAPLFPGYIFVGLDPADGLWRAVNSTYGITRLISFTDTPAVVPSDLVFDLKLRCDADGLLLPPEKLNQGDQVKLTTGPFANFIAQVESVAPDQRIWVLLDLMGRATRVAIDREQLTKL